MAAALENLRAARDQAGHGWLGVDIGPTGHLMAPMGDLDFDEAVASFLKRSGLVQRQERMRWSSRP